MCHFVRDILTINNMGSFTADLQLFSQEFLLLEKLGEGGFGGVWRAEHKPTGNSAAVKITKVKNTLQHEYAIYKILRKRDKTLFSTKPIPDIIGQGKIGELNWLGMNLLGPSLHKLFESSGKFTIETIMMLGIQMLNCLQFLHRCNIIHGDVKGENFAVSASDPSKIVIFDFGLSREENSGFSGTLLYASIAAHELKPMKRKDDLESLAYTLADFHKSLPWKNVKWPECPMKQVEFGLNMKKEKNIFALSTNFFELTLFFMHIGSQYEPSCAFLKNVFR